jgi:hypothetical protein
MGSKSPKWKIKLKRKKINEARRAFRKAHPGEKITGIQRMAQHGGANKRAHP